MNNCDYSLTNQWWELKIQNENNENYIYKLRSKKYNVVYADQDYHYRKAAKQKI